MEIKVGQWIRDRYGNIFSVLDVYQNEYYCLVNETLEGVDFKSIIKVANTPQELIQVGDLVDILYTGNNSYYKLEVIEFTKNVLTTSHLTITTSQTLSFHYDNDLSKLPMIRKIYTPNKDKSQYTLQWEAKSNNG